MIAMSIAGYDPSGGAGILNDIKTFSAFGVYGFGVITAVTAQNINEIKGILPLDINFINKQIETVLDQEKIEYVKIGMLYSDKIIKTVSKKVLEYDLKVIVDPVMIAESGGLLSQNIGDSLKDYLFPLAELTTPNIFEAEILSGIKINNIKDAEKAAKEIGKYCNVVVTGGHLDGTDIFYDGSLHIIKNKLLKSNNTHGSGCTFSSAIVAGRLKGYDIENAIINAGKFVKKSIKFGNNGTLNQFWKIYKQI
jgi:hydroxymethylpyrimidine/phosphomethylpyrimidine kinase